MVAAVSENGGATSDAVEQRVQGCKNHNYLLEKQREMRSTFHGLFHVRRLAYLIPVSAPITSSNNRPLLLQVIQDLEGMISSI